MSKMRTKRGDSTDIFKVTVSGIDDYTDYRGEVAVLDSTTGNFIVEKFVISPDVSSGFSVAFAPAQTQLIEVGDYTVVFEVIKEVSGVIEFRRELSWSLQITESLLNN
jgi:hypothetical protein